MCSGSAPVISRPRSTGLIRRRLDRGAQSRRQVLAGGVGLLGRQTPLLDREVGAVPGRIDVLDALRRDSARLSA